VGWPLQISLGAHRVLGVGQYRRLIGTLTLGRTAPDATRHLHFTPRSASGE